MLCALKAPFPYFGGKSTPSGYVWQRLGRVKQYIEPFCGSAAVLLANPHHTPLEVVSDANRYIANFWRCVKCQPDHVWEEQDYPVSHIDLSARHRWLTDPGRVQELDRQLQDPEWPGDARVAGWWVWGQCSWIGSGWCSGAPVGGKIPHAGDAGRGLQAHGKIPHASNAGRGLSAWRTRAREWLAVLSTRLERVRIQHGDWSRCLNNHYGGASTAVFLDPPYKGFESLYGTQQSVAAAVEEWAREYGGEMRVALCGHRGDYDLPGWDVYSWSRGRLTYSGGNTTDDEAIWFSPMCEPPVPTQGRLF